MLVEIGLILLEILTVCVDGLTMEGCEDGWIFHKHLCYQLNSDPYSTLTHGEAIAVCMAKGADLTSVWGKKERDFISQELLNTSKEKSAWIGLRQDYRSNKYVWAWSDGSPADEASWKYGLT